MSKECWPALLRRARCPAQAERHVSRAGARRGGRQGRTKCSPIRAADDPTEHGPICVALPGLHGRARPTFAEQPLEGGRTALFGNGAVRRGEPRAIHSNRAANRNSIDPAAGRRALAGPFKLACPVHTVPRRSRYFMPLQGGNFMFRMRLRTP